MFISFFEIAVILGRRPLICQFSSPVIDNYHSPQAVILEGKYWKRTLCAVVKEYQKWRVFYKKKMTTPGFHEEELDDAWMQGVCSHDAFHICYIDLLSKMSVIKSFWSIDTVHFDQIKLKSPVFRTRNSAEFGKKMETQNFMENTIFVEPTEVEGRLRDPNCVRLSSALCPPSIRDATKTWITFQPCICL